MGFGGELAHQTEHADAASETSSQPEQKCFYWFLFRTPLPREGLGGGVTPLLGGVGGGSLSDLLLDLVLRQLLTLRTLQELLDAVAGRIGRALGGEHDVHARDVILNGEGLGGARSLRGNADLERAEAVELDTLRVLQLVAHGLYQLVQNGEDIGLLHGTVALHDLRQFAGVNHRHGYGTGVPLTAALGSYTLVLM